MLHSLAKSYSGGLVGLSVAVAILASLSALDLAGRVHASRGRVRNVWLSGGALTMGLGIWSMHIIGMLALHLPVSVTYRPLELILSLTVAIGASWFALSVSARETVRPVHLAAAAAGMGMAIAGMHYIGMTGMDMQADVEFDNALLLLSLLIAVLSSFAALYIARALRSSESTRNHLARCGAAVLMGCAIAGMHYTGMAAANFIPRGFATSAASGGLPTVVIAMAVGAMSTFMAGVVLFGAMLDRLMHARTIEVRLRAEKQAAESTNRAKSDFLASMSHELRTPLNSIIGFSKILHKNKAENLRPVDLLHAQRIISNGTHLLGVINRVLDLSKIEAGTVQLSADTVDVSTLVVDTLAELEVQARSQDVTLETDLPIGMHPIETDNARFKQIVINLVDNAMKFAPGGRVTVRVFADAHGLPNRLDVVDDGIGIPADRLEGIFDAFVQADSTTSHRFGGTGLGLTITRSLAELMGWRVSVQSEPGVGTTFRVHIAARPAALTPTSTEVIKAQTTPRRVFRVLVIDDNPDARALIQHEFEELGCEVILASDADEGIQLARNSAPDLITLDVLMPRKSGFDALAEIQGDRALAGIKVVMVTVMAEEARARVGETDVIGKPLSRDAIARLIEDRTTLRRKLVLVDTKGSDRASARFVEAFPFPVMNPGAFRRANDECDEQPSDDEHEALLRATGSR